MREYIENHINTLSKHIVVNNPFHKEININTLLCTKYININFNKLNFEIDHKYTDLIEDCEISLPNMQFYDDIGLKVNKSLKSTYVYEYVSKTIQSGITAIVAFTGWRRSEYAFSLNDICIYGNKDILDQKSYPFRYEVNWVVPKTNGKTKVKREITSNIYNLLKQTDLLINSKINMPCMYSGNGAIVDNKLPTHILQNAVRSMWPHFVRNYKPFETIDEINELDELKEKINSSKEIEKRRLYLIKQSKTLGWKKIKNDILLNEVYHRTRKEISRFEFVFGDQRRKLLIDDYRKGVLNKEYTLMMNEFLSDEIREQIMRLKTKDAISSHVSKAVFNDIMSECIYPSPHAFRHMWAESVYRRFDGDVGWMIRSSFKHISQNMWLAYINDKDNRRQHELVKRRVISSIMQKYIANNDIIYSGAMDKMLRRLFAKTKIIDINDLKNEIEKFTQFEIEDVKSNPWGYCLLRSRNQHKAKCFNEGAPQRHNASPSLCLGCCNSLTHENHLEGILLNVANDIKVLNTPMVPDTFVEASRITVFNALIHLKKLAAPKKIIDEFQTALDISHTRVAS